MTDRDIRAKTRAWHTAKDNLECVELAGRIVADLAVGMVSDLAARELTLQQIRRITERATELATARLTAVVAEVAGALDIQPRTSPTRRRKPAVTRSRPRPISIKLAGTP